MVQVERSTELPFATVDDYRIKGGDDRLMSMWSKIAQLSEDLTKAIAIGDANCPQITAESSTIHPLVDWGHISNCCVPFRRICPSQDICVAHSQTRTTRS